MALVVALVRFRISVGMWSTGAVGASFGRLYADNVVFTVSGGGCWAEGSAFNEGTLYHSSLHRSKQQMS